MPETDAQSLPRTPNWLIFSLVAIGIFMATLDGSIVNIALPSIMTDFEVELATIQWVVMIYLLTVTSLLLSFGRLSDIRGRRIVYSLGLFLFSFGSLFCGLAQSAHWLIVSRFFQGLGAAMTMACRHDGFRGGFRPHSRTGAGRPADPLFFLARHFLYKHPHRAPHRHRSIFSPKGQQGRHHQARNL
jgi:hypothetical protein